MLIMEKIYNHINWKFFLYLLARCNFEKKWLRWIEFCISITLFSILVIGLLVGFFNSSHGLRQRDLFSPSLFLFIMETLSKMIKGLVEGGFLHGFSLGKSDYGSINIFYRLFANDTLIFCYTNLKHIQSLRALLLYFKVILRLKINISKSELVPMGVVFKWSFMSLSCVVRYLIFP